MGSPRDDVVFRLWQCDKENHGWREGPPLTVPCQSFDLLAGPSPSRQNQLRTKKEYSFAPLAARSSIRTLAGLKRLPVKVVSPLPERDFLPGEAASGVHTECPRTAGVLLRRGPPGPQTDDRLALKRPDSA
jgi:hypothetical protein